MTTTPAPQRHRTHPVHAFAGAAVAAVGRVADSPTWAMSAGELAETITDLARLSAMVEELKLRALAAAETTELAADRGASSTAAWLAVATRQTRVKAHAEVHLATALDRPLLTVTRRALAAGAVNTDQARVVVACLRDLDGDDSVSDGQRVQAQQHLVALAADHDAKALRVLARRIFEVLAPETADAREEKKLADEEREARRRASFRTRDNLDGTTSGWFMLPTAQAEMLTKAVHAFAAPRRRHLTDRSDDRAPDGRPVPWREQLGRAFAALVEHLPTDQLPSSGGLNAAVIVTIGIDRLTRGLGSGALDTGETISAGQVRRMACTAGILPVVLGGASEVLDVGRQRRLHTPAMRKALVVRDRGCTTDGCDRPAAWCETHHPDPWAGGGSTSLENSRLLCPRHHHHAHDPTYDMRTLANGQVRFHKRT